MNILHCSFAKGLSLQRARNHSAVLIRMAMYTFWTNKSICQLEDDVERHHLIASCYVQYMSDVLIFTEQHLVLPKNEFGTYNFNCN